MSTNDFLQELHARIAAHDLLCHPFYQAWSAGELTREDLHEYAQQYFAHVEAFPAYLSAFAGRLAPGTVREAVLANMKDELGESPRSHAEIWLDFAEGMGGNREGAPQVAKEMSELVAAFQNVAENGTPAEALAAFYAYESQVPRIAKTKEQGLREWYGADDRTCGYFTLHATADVHHANVWRSQLTALVTNDAVEQERALQAAENASKALWRALDGMEAARHTSA
ncbi:MAG: iron-containing redox enzyme family protein [Acidobacteriales bacterium]|nr:iron-containing redox enzyme family protein [Terriglobales bacterium]